MMKSSLILLAISIVCCANAQLPETDIYMSNIHTKNGELIFSKPENITNRKGYDNQPYFTPDGKSLLFVSATDTNQTDIYRYDFNTKKISQLTNTTESEYSPSLSPDGKNISVVRVDKDGGQRFYDLPLNNLNEPSLITGTDSIGYYCWLNDSSLAMFILGDAMSLQILNTSSHTRKWIASDIGRCLKLSPDKKIMYFVIKQNENEWGIFNLDCATYKIKKVVATLGGSEDFAVMADGSLLMGSKGKLFRFSHGKDSEWKEVADFSSSLGDFYRITISPKGDRIALVAFTGKKP
jgi:ABC-type uncharacterized transport system permease subunit